MSSVRIGCAVREPGDGAPRPQRRGGVARGCCCTRRNLWIIGASGSALRRPHPPSTETHRKQSMGQHLQASNLRWTPPRGCGTAFLAMGKTSLILPAWRPAGSHASRHAPWTSYVHRGRFESPAAAAAGRPASGAPPAASSPRPGFGAPRARGEASGAHAIAPRNKTV